MMRLRWNSDGLVGRRLCCSRRVVTANLMLVALDPRHKLLLLIYKIVRWTKLPEVKLKVVPPIPLDAVVLVFMFLEFC